MIITSLQNPRVKAAIRLRERRHRDRERLALVEGFDELCHALDAGVIPVTLFVEQAAAGSGRGRPLVERVRKAGAEVLETSPAVFAKLAYREHPDGWLAIVPVPDLSLSALETGPVPLVLVIDGVEKPGNLGAMLRTADAAGAPVILSEAATDAFNPNVIRASKGAVFSTPLASASAAEVLGWLEECGLRLIAATPDAETPYTSADLAGPAAIVVGAEDRGLSSAWLEAAHQRVRIPMTGRVNSLNVATAAALLLYEAVRQRSK